NLHEQSGKFPELSSEGVIAESNSPDARIVKELKDGEVYYSKVIATTHNEIGLLRAGGGDFKAAAEQFALAAKSNAELEGLNFNWGLAAFKSELYQEAIAALENELSVHPEIVQCRQLL